MNPERKKYIEELLRKTNKEGIESLILYLNTSDFYTAPASTKQHNNFVGGLAKHSWNVFERLNHKTCISGITIEPAQAMLVAILHDLCKVNHYVKKKKHWEINDDLPLGHGPKSLARALSLGLNLTEEEMCAIRWHMGPRTPSTHMGWPDASDYKRAWKKYPLVILLCTADMEASKVIEK